MLGGGGKWSGRNIQSEELSIWQLHEEINLTGQEWELETSGLRCGFKIFEISFHLWFTHLHQHSSQKMEPLTGHKQRRERSNPTRRCPAEETSNSSLYLMECPMDRISAGRNHRAQPDMDDVIDTNRHSIFTTPNAWFVVATYGHSTIVHRRNKYI